MYTGIPAMVPDVTIDDNTININGNNVTLTLSWGEPFNNFDPIVNYTVSCSGDVTCPPNFTTTDNNIRSYTITNLTPMTNYTFSVVATNSIGSGEAGIVMITTPRGKVIPVVNVHTYIQVLYLNSYMCMCICMLTYLFYTLHKQNIDSIYYEHAYVRVLKLVLMSFLQLYMQLLQGRNKLI